MSKMICLMGESGSGPCGACRQVILDVQRRQGVPIRLIMSGNGSASVVESADALLPFTFQL